MLARPILFCLFALPAVAFADARDGQFMGYQLGTNFQEAAQSVEGTTTGNLLIVVEDALKPADIEQVILVATPTTRTIGYIGAASWFATEDEARVSARRYVELLRAKYPDWSFGREVMDANLRIGEVNFDQAPYTLKLHLGQEVHEGQTRWRFSMGLGWQPNAKEWRSWQDKADSEQSSEKTAEDEQKLKDSDMRGL